MPKTPRENFAKYINKNGTVMPAMQSECWEWTGTLQTSGYGCFGFRGKNQGAHRVAMMLSGVELNAGECVCHRCDNPLCVRVEHLFVGSHADNHRDKMSKGRHGYGTAPGEAHGAHKLTNADVMEVRRLRKSGVRLMRIAEQFGVSHVAVSMIARRVTWKHLP